MEDLSSAYYAGLTGKSSMAPTTMTSAIGPFQPPGSASQSTDGVTPGSPGPHGTGPGDVSAKNTAGPGDRGGILPADGRDPGDGFGWENVNDRPDVSAWTTSVPAHYRDDRQ